MAYKGFDKDLKCQGFQYEIGKTYELREDENVVLCCTGFHYCGKPLNVFRYYPPKDGERYCIVTPKGECFGEVPGDKSVASKITIEKETSLTEMVEDALGAIEEKSYCQTRLAALDYEDQIAKGEHNRQLSTKHSTNQLVDGEDNHQFAVYSDNLQIALGQRNSQIGGSYSKQITKGQDNYQYLLGCKGIQINYGMNGRQCVIGDGLYQISHGDYSIQFGTELNKNFAGYPKQIANGDLAIQFVAHRGCRQEINGKMGISINAAIGGKVKLGKNGAAVLRWVDKKGRSRFKVLYEGEKGIEAGVWYELGGNGRVCEVKGENK
jgi:hypothetical protein